MLPDPPPPGASPGVPACGDCGEPDRRPAARGRCWRCYHHRRRHGAPRPRVACTGCGAPVGLRSVRCRACRAQAAAATAAAREARRAARATASCRTCRGPLRARGRHAAGECGPCATYRARLGRERPARLFGAPPGRPRQRGPRACTGCADVGRIIAHDLCSPCYQRRRRAAGEPPPGSPPGPTPLPPSTPFKEETP